MVKERKKNGGGEKGRKYLEKGWKEENEDRKENRRGKVKQMEEKKG